MPGAPVGIMSSATCTRGVLAMKSFRFGSFNADLRTGRYEVWTVQKADCLVSVSHLMKSHAACCLSGVLFMIARLVPENSERTGLPGAVGTGAIPISNASLTALAMNGSPAMVVTGDMATFFAPKSFCQSKPLLTYAMLLLTLFTSKLSAA